MNKRTAWVAVAFLVVGAMLLSGCGGATPTSEPAAPAAEPATSAPEPAAPEATHEPVTLVWWDQYPTPPRSTVVEEMLASFMAQYPWITVTRETFGWADYFQKVDLTTAGGGAPDVFLVDNTRIRNYVYNDVIQPLDKYVAAGYQDDWFPIPQTEMAYDGHIWAIPMQQSTEQIIYNKDIVAAAGLEPPTGYDAPWTFEDFQAALEKVTVKRADGTTEIWGFDTNYDMDDYGIQPWVAAHGGSYMDPDWTTYEGYANGDKTVEATNYLVDFYRNGYAPIQRIPDLFQTGQVGFYQSNAFALTDIADRFPDLNVGVMPLPCDETCAVQSGAYHLGIHAQSEHPDEAWLLIDYFTNFDGHKRWIEGTGYMPARLSVYEALPQFQEYPLSVYMDGLASHAIRRAATEGYAVFNGEMWTAWQNMITGADVRSEMDRVTQISEEELQRYK